MWCANASQVVNIPQETSLLMEREVGRTDYKIVMDKLRRSQGSSVPEDEENLREIVEVPFPTGEPRTSFPNQEHRVAGEPFSLQELKAAVSRLSPGNLS